MTNNWYVITGGPSTGKTTLLAELEKLGHKTVSEAARTLIDEALEKGITANELRSDEKRFQEQVVHLKEKLENEHDINALTFFDRGMQDTLAYMRHYGFEVDQWIETLMRRAKYQKVFLLEPLADYHSDYARTENHDFTKHLHELLREVYQEFGMKTIDVPAESPENRAKFVLNHM